MSEQHSRSTSRNTPEQIIHSIPQEAPAASSRASVWSSAAILSLLFAGLSFAIVRQNSSPVDGHSAPAPHATVIARNTIRTGGTPTPTPSPTPTRNRRVEESTRLEDNSRELLFKVDLDIDSDNSGVIEHSEQEDSVEETWPGKMMVAHIMDTDYDGIPDFADGITNVEATSQVTTWDGSPVGSAGVNFTPMVATFEIEGRIPAGTSVRLSCSPTPDSIVPESIIVQPDYPEEGGNFFLNDPFGELRYRLWTKDGTSERDGRPFNSGGDRIECGEEMDFDEFRSRASRMYIEPLGVTAHRQISITLFVEIPSVDENDDRVIIRDGSNVYDSIVAQIVEVGVSDVRGWDPQWQPDAPQPGNYGAGNLGFRYAPDRITGRWGTHYRIGGAVTDGAAVAILNLAVPSAHGQNLEDRISVRIDPVSGNAVSDDADVPRVFGGLKPVFNSEGNFTPPPVPMPRFAVQSAGLHRKQPFLDGVLYYVPPRNFLTSLSAVQSDPSSANLLTIDPQQEVADVRFTILMRTGDGPRSERVIGHVPFRLRRPPLIVVHGLNGQGGAGYWDMQDWDESNSSLATRLYYADYRETSDKGYSENLFSVPQAIDRAHDDYRRSRDSIAGGGSTVLDRHLAMRSFRRIRYAISKVDVAGHSMGGQITRAFISNVSGSHPRLGFWPNMIFSRGGVNAYFRSTNLGAGAIRRFIPIGSPFLGSPYATGMEPHIRPGNLAREYLITAGEAQRNTIGELLIRMNLLRTTSGGNLMLTTPTAVSDLANGSPAQTLLENAEYPTGDKAVMWYPIAGFAELNEHSDRLPLGAGEGWDMIQCLDSIPGDPVVWAYLRNLVRGTYDTGLTAPISDYVVPTNSQRNAQVRGQTENRQTLREGTEFLNNWNIGFTVPKTTHSFSILSFQPICTSNGQSLLAEFGQLGLDYENGSAVIVGKLGEVLVASDDLPEHGPTNLNQGGEGGLQSTGLGLPY